jgi:organic radical activating enzyme
MRLPDRRPVVHLVHPPPYGEVPFKHLGLAYVAAGLRAYGFETSYHDLSERHHRRGEDFYDDLILRLSRRAGEMSDLPFLDLLGEVLFPEFGDSPLAARIRAQVDQALESLGDAEVVGMSFNPLTTYFTVALGRLLRARGVRVLLGGPLSSIAPLTHLMLRLGAADAILAGAGDVAAGSLVEALVDSREPIDVPGAIWLSQGAVRENAAQACPPLDSLPWPELQGNILDWFIPLQASRGCTRRCLYCSETGIWGRNGYERRAPESVVRELCARADATGLTDFHFHDDLLNGSRPWMDSFVRQTTGLGFKWESFFEPYGLDETLVFSMAAAGCRLVKLGVQSFSPSVLKAMGRAPRPEAIVQAVIATYRAGMSTHYDMLIGHPGETEEDHQLNLKAVEDLYGKTGEKLYFSLNPFYLAAGSEIERSPERFGVELVMANPQQLPPPLAEAIAGGPPYPVGYRSAIPRETTMRRMRELGEILRRHGKDYLYLGQDAVPDPGPRGRRMLPALPDESGGHELVEAAERRGRDLGDAPVVTLNATSNLRAWAGLGQVRSLVHPGVSLDVVVAALRGIAPSSVVRIAGGEPTLSEHLPAVISAAQRLGLQVTLETNGLRFSHQSYAQALVRLGLSHVLVLLLDTDPVRADAIGGVQGSFELASQGIAALIETGAKVEVGILASAANVSAVGTLADVVHERWPSVKAVRVVMGPIAGSGALESASPVALRPLFERLVRSAVRWGIDVAIDTRGR